MTIQIDDAGWGCLLGGVIIGALRVETEEYVWDEVPIVHFQGEAFGRGEYLSAATEVAKHLVERLQVQKDEQVQVCTGSVLSGIRDWLRSDGYAMMPTKIEGRLQDLIEDTLRQHLEKIGVRVNMETLTQKQGLLFWYCVRWLKGGNVNNRNAVPEREAFAKTGWGTYSAWAHHPYQQAKDEARRIKARRKRDRQRGSYWDD